MHISTAYSQADKPIVEEKHYPSEADWKKTIKIAETLDEELLKTFTPKWDFSIHLIYLQSNLSNYKIERKNNNANIQQTLVFFGKYICFFSYFFASFKKEKWIF